MIDGSCAALPWCGETIPHAGELGGPEQRRQEPDADPDAPDVASLAPAKAAVRIGLRAARDVPVVGAVAEEFDAETLVEQADRMRAFLSRRLRGDDGQLLLSPDDVLTPVFVADLQRAMVERPMVLFVDTYESCSTGSGIWIGLPRKA